MEPGDRVRHRTIHQAGIGTIRHIQDDGLVNVIWDVEKGEPPFFDGAISYLHDPSTLVLISPAKSS